MGPASSIRDRLRRELRALRATGPLNPTIAVNRGSRGHVSAIYQDDEVTVIHHDGHTETIHHGPATAEHGGERDRGTCAG